MSVYIDSARIPYCRMKMSHLIADTTEELLAMVDAIGISRKWIQYPGTCREHFDVCGAKRQAAIDRGAKPVSLRRIAEIIRAKRDDAKGGGK